MRHLTQRGFTLVEVLVVAPIIILSIGAFIALIVTLTGNTLASRGSSVMQYNIQDALDRIEEDVKQSAALLAVNDISLGSSNPQGYLANPETPSTTGSTVDFTNVDKSGSGGSTAALILKQFAVKEIPMSGDTSVIYLANSPNPCSGDYKRNEPVYTNVVYYVADDVLWRRTLTPTNYDTSGALCGGPIHQRPSCSPGTTHAYCKTHDSKLIEDVAPEGFTVTYYNSTDSAAPNTSVVNPSSSDAARSTALELVTTVEASIESTKTIAGRDVTKTGTMRATRLNSTDNISKPTMPSSVQSVVFDGRKVLFSWQAAEDANIYDIEYRINGGTWQTGATLTDSYSYTVTANHTDKVEARVLARNIKGASTYATGSATVPLWAPLNLTSGWSNYAGDYTTAAYTRTPDGFVILKGLLKHSGSPGSYSVIASLPEDYAPTGRLMFGVSTWSNTSGRVDVNTNGDLLFGLNSHPTWTSLDSIRFVAANAGQTRTSMSLRNGFINYGGSYAPASWVQDSTGRVSIQGLLNNGTRTMNNPISTLPAAIRPAQYQHFPSRSGTFHHIAISSDVGLLARGDGSGAYSINASYMPASHSDWSNMSLYRWVPYGGIYATPQYTKTADGVVHLKGLIQKARRGTETPTTLPQGFRPSERILTVTASHDNYARLDILPNGQITLSGDGSAWVSLNGITFIAE